MVMRTEHQVPRVASGRALKGSAPIARVTANRKTPRQESGYHGANAASAVSPPMAESMAMNLRSQQHARHSHTSGDAPHPASAAAGMVAVPSSFRCPLTSHVMRDPVATCDGQVYERFAIEEWLRQGHRASPVTGLELETRTLVPQLALRAAIDAFLAHPSVPNEVSGGHAEDLSPGSSSRVKSPGRRGHEEAEMQHLINGLQSELRRAEQDVAASASASSVLAEPIEMARQILSSAGGAGIHVDDFASHSKQERIDSPDHVANPAQRRRSASASRTGSPTRTGSPSRARERSQVRELSQPRDRPTRTQSRSASPTGARRSDGDHAADTLRHSRSQLGSQRGPQRGASPGPAATSSSGGNNSFRSTPRRPASSSTIGAPRVAGAATAASRAKDARNSGAPVHAQVIAGGNSSGNSKASRVAPAAGGAGVRQKSPGQQRSPSPTNGRTGGTSAPNSSGRNRASSPSRIGSGANGAVRAEAKRGAQPTNAASGGPRGPLGASRSRPGLDSTNSATSVHLSSHATNAQRNTSAYYPPPADAAPADSLRGPGVPHQELSPVPKVDEIDEAGRTPLMHAAGEGDVDSLLRQISFGVAVDAQDECKCTALMYAATYGHIEAVCCLVEHGAAVEATSKDGWTPLITAAYNGHLGVVRYLLAQGSHIEAADERGWTALMHVAFNGDNDTLCCLLEHGAHVDTLDGDGRTALVYAAFNGHLNNVRCLLARSDKENRGPQVDGPKDVALLFAAINGHAEVVRMLLEAVSSLHGEGVAPETRRAASRLAADHGHEAVVELLMGANAVGENPQNADMGGA